MKPLGLYDCGWAFMQSWSQVLVFLWVLWGLDHSEGVWCPTKEVGEESIACSCTSKSYSSNGRAKLNLGACSQPIVWYLQTGHESLVPLCGQTHVSPTPWGLSVSWTSLPFPWWFTAPELLCTHCRWDTRAGSFSTSMCDGCSFITQLESRKSWDLVSRWIEGCLKT